MISFFDIALLGAFAWAGQYLWSNTTSTAARAVSLGSLVLLSLRLLGS
ncbi:MAG: hypothetical protein JRG94_17620 [Deltaproteobacteria bacterium]|nr:hypothetical protein [Deltaproteobacteria bacterium]